MQRSRPKDQQLGTRLGNDLGGPAQDGIRVLARSPEAARLRTEGRGARIPRWNARRHRPLSYLEIATRPERLDQRFGGHAMGDARSPVDMPPRGTQTLPVEHPGREE